VAASNGSELETDISADVLQKYANIQKIRIVPSSVGLRSICINLSPVVSTEALELASVEFERGWGEGLMQLTGLRTRLRQSLVNGVHMVRYAAHGSEGINVDSEEEGIGELVSIQNEDEDAFKAVVVDGGEGRCPVLCLAGSSHREGIEHARGCGHEVGREVWRDEL